MDPYLRRLLSQPPLPPEAEHRLATLARGGDSEARQALVMAGMRSVVQRALMLGLRGEELRDGVQAGAVGLIRAVDRFDPDRGARLATFSWSWIGAALASRQTGPVSAAAPVAHEVPARLLLEGLPQHLAEVLDQRFGLVGDQPPRSRRVVGERLGLTESQVRTLEAEAMRHLRGRLAKIGHRAPRDIGHRASRQREADPP